MMEVNIWVLLTSFSTCAVALVSFAWYIFKYQNEILVQPIIEMRNEQQIFRGEVEKVKQALSDIQQELHRRLTIKDGTPIEVVIEKMSEQFDLMADRDTFNFYLDSQPKYECDSNGLCTRVNEKWCGLTGLSEQHAIGNGWMKIIHPNDQTRVQRLWDDFVEKDYPFEPNYRIITNDNPDGLKVKGRAFSKRKGEHIKLILGVVEICQ